MLSAALRRRVVMSCATTVCCIGLVSCASRVPAEAGRTHAPREKFAPIAWPAMPISEHERAAITPPVPSFCLMTIDSAFASRRRFTVMPTLLFAVCHATSQTPEGVVVEIEPVMGSEKGYAPPGPVRLLQFRRFTAETAEFLAKRAERAKLPVPIPPPPAARASPQAPASAQRPSGDRSHSRTALGEIPGLLPWADVPTDDVTFRWRTPSGEPRGIVVWLSSLGGQAYERPIVMELVRRGWIVLSGNAGPSRGGMELYPYFPGGEEKTARAVAQDIDARYAMFASAAAGVIAHIDDRTTPGGGADNGTRAARLPVVIVGCSAGTLPAAAIACKLGGRAAGVVLVGGGANTLDIALHSTFTNGGITIVPITRDRLPSVASLMGKGPAPLLSDAIEQGLLRAYERCTVLDSVVLAPRLTHVPVLMLHARSDTIVPAHTGERLWELLGRPERWSYGFGHELLFWYVRNEKREIGDWLDREVLGP